jgi:hypothetical protein
MKTYLKTFPTTTNVIGFQSYLKFSSFFYYLILVTEVDLRPKRVNKAIVMTVRCLHDASWSS